MSLTKEQILQADDLARVKVEVPDWGGVVYVRTMTGAERDSFEQAIAADGADAKLKLANIRARLAALTVVNEKGERLFTEADMVALGNKSASMLDAIFTVATRLNALTAADVEDLAKNSPGAPSGASTSA